MNAPRTQESPAFEVLYLLADDLPRDGPSQMALDEALLENVSAPILRVYRWEGSWASFGYSQSRETAARTLPGTDLVRRWTGGGIVDHRRDWTFSLVVPREESFVAVRPAESYCRIHRAVALALADDGIPTTLADETLHEIPAACFVGKPARHDVLNSGGAKLCGGAQRRTRAGLLHQGSLQQVAETEGFLSQLASALAARTLEFSLPDMVRKRAEALASEKYRSSEWLHRFP